MLEWPSTGQRGLKSEGPPPDLPLPLSPSCPCAPTSSPSGLLTPPFLPHSSLSRLSPASAVPNPSPSYPVFPTLPLLHSSSSPPTPTLPTSPSTPACSSHLSLPSPLSHPLSYPCPRILPMHSASLRKFQGQKHSPVMARTPSRCRLSEWGCGAHAW